MFYCTSSSSSIIIVKNEAVDIVFTACLRPQHVYSEQKGPFTLADFFFTPTPTHIKQQQQNIVLGVELLRQLVNAALHQKCTAPFSSSVTNAFSPPPCVTSSARRRAFNRIRKESRNTQATRTHFHKPHIDPQTDLERKRTRRNNQEKEKKKKKSFTISTSIPPPAPFSVSQTTTNNNQPTNWFRTEQKKTIGVYLRTPILLNPAFPALLGSALWWMYQGATPPPPAAFGEGSPGPSAVNKYQPDLAAIDGAWRSANLPSPEAPQDTSNSTPLSSSQRSTAHRSSTPPSSAPPTAITQGRSLPQHSLTPLANDAEEGELWTSPSSNTIFQPPKPLGVPGGQQAAVQMGSPPSSPGFHALPRTGMDAVWESLQEHHSMSRTMSTSMLYGHLEGEAAASDLLEASFAAGDTLNSTSKLHHPQAPLEQSIRIGSETMPSMDHDALGRSIRHGASTAESAAAGPGQTMESIPPAYHHQQQEPPVSPPLQPIDLVEQGRYPTAALPMAEAGGGGGSSSFTTTTTTNNNNSTYRLGGGGGGLSHSGALPFASSRGTADDPLAAAGGAGPALLEATEEALSALEPPMVMRPLQAHRFPPLAHPAHTTATNRTPAHTHAHANAKLNVMRPPTPAPEGAATALPSATTASRTRDAATTQLVALCVSPNVSLASPRQLESTIRRLVERGADVGFCGPGMKQPILHHFISLGMVECVRACLETQRPVDFTAVDHPCRLNSPLLCCFRSPESARSISVLRLLVERITSHPLDVVNWGQKNQLGNDILNAAAAVGRLSAVWEVVRSVPYFCDYSLLHGKPMVLHRKPARWDWNMLGEEQQARFSLLNGLLDDTLALARLCKEKLPSPWAMESCVEAGADVLFHGAGLHMPILHTLICRGLVPCVGACLQTSRALTLTRRGTRAVIGFSPLHCVCLSPAAQTPALLENTDADGRLTGCKKTMALDNNKTTTKNHPPPLPPYRCAIYIYIYISKHFFFFARLFALDQANFFLLSLIFFF
eukprot:gene3785-2676_t